MSMRMSELSGSAYSTPTRNRYSSNYGSTNENSQSRQQKELSSDVLTRTLTASMKKQSEKSELFDIELEDNDFFKVDRTIEEINMLAAKSFAYSKNSGLADIRTRSPESSYGNTSEVKVGFQPIKPTPTKTRTPKYRKYDLSGKSFFSEPHVYPRKPASQAFQDNTFTGQNGEPFGNFEFFRATPIRTPPDLL